MTGTTVTWSSGDASVATVDASGLVTAASNGEATITATAGAATGSAVVTVAQAVASVEVTPSAVAMSALGSTQQLTAEGFDENGNAVEGAQFSWASSDTAVATVDADGLVTAVGSGTATITATAGEVSGSAALTVQQVAVAVSLSPAADTLSALGDTARFVAEATDRDDNVIRNAQFLWASSDTAVATVDTDGLVTAVDNGTATITAMAGEVSASAVLTVEQVAAAVSVSPTADTLVALGDVVRLTAEATDANGNLVVNAEFSWASGDTAVATVDEDGLVTAVDNGTATITATAGEVSGSAVLTVAQEVTSVTVLPATDTLSVGNTLQLTAEATDANGNPVVDAEFSWESGDAAVATVDEDGLVTAVGSGTATITATAGELSASTALTVVNRDREALIALFAATNGPHWSNNRNWLTDAPLGDWSGVRTDRLGRVYDIYLDNRGLEGTLPPELGDLGSLRRLALGSNDLTGSIPPELGKLANLQELYLWFNELTGPIPPELGNLANLVGLYLSENALTGPIPPELGNLANLVGLYLSENALTGPIPPELGKLANLKQLNLRENELTGIPPELGKLANLQGLYLWSNELTGPIPPELGNLANLEVLYLTSNELTGSLPPELGNLANLVWLFLDKNALSGPLPESFLNLSKLTHFYHVPNDGLCVPQTLRFLTWWGRIDLTSSSPWLKPLCNAAAAPAARPALSTRLSSSLR